MAWAAPHPPTQDSPKSAQCVRMPMLSHAQRIRLCVEDPQRNLPGAGHLWLPGLCTEPPFPKGLFFPSSFFHFLPPQEER